jgi:nucleotide-binding universal stress UspA family protein
MSTKLFHVYRNTPFGRETFLQAIDFCKKSDAELYVLAPQFDRFMFYFDADAVEVNLDQSYLAAPNSQKENMEQILTDMSFNGKNVYSTTRTGSTLPDISSDFDIINLPRVMTQVVKGLRGSTIGPAVRRLIKASHAPALICQSRFVDWQAIRVFFGGSRHAEKALLWAHWLSLKSQKPIHLTTLLEDKDEDYYRGKMKKRFNSLTIWESWDFWPKDKFYDALFSVERDELLVMGAYGKSGLKKRLLGSTTELMLKNTPNPLLLVGERCKEPTDE